MNKLKKTNLFDFMSVSGTTIACTGAMFIYNVYVRKYVGPYDYGIFTSANLLLMYLNYLQFGVLNSYNRDYPQLVGGGDNRAEHKKSVVWTFLLIEYGIVGIVSAIIFIVVWRKGLIETKLFVGFMVNSLLAPLTVIYGFYDATIRSNGKFVYSSKMLVLKTFVVISVGIVCVIKFGLYGLYVSASVALMVILTVNIKFFCKIKLAVDLKSIWEMIKTGAPLLLNSLVWTVMMSIDRFVILAYMTMFELGVYSVALLGFSTLIVIPQSIAQVFYIKMSQVYGATKDVELLFENVVKSTRVLSLISALISVASYYILPIFIKIVMPKYSDGIVAAQILIIGVALFSTTLLFSSILNVMKLNIRLLISTGILCILTFLFTIGSIKILGVHINSVAFGTSLAYFIYSFVLITITCKTFKKHVLKILLITWLPVLFLLLPGILISIFISGIYFQILSLAVLVALFVLIFYRKDVASLIRGRKINAR